MLFPSTFSKENNRINAFVGIVTATQNFPINFFPEFSPIDMEYILEKYLRKSTSLGKTSGKIAHEVHPKFGSICSSSNLYRKVANAKNVGIALIAGSMVI